MMITKAKSLATLAFLSLASVAPVSARTYNLNFGPTLTRQITANDTLTGGGYAVTGISGMFMGQPIIGLVNNPSSPDLAYYVVATGSVQTEPAPDSFKTYEYFFDNLIFPTQSLDENGLLFSTSNNVANVFEEEGGFFLDYVPAGPSDAVGQANPLPGDITLAAPEPSIWLMLLIGFAIAGRAIRGSVPAPRLGRGRSATGAGLEAF